MGRPVTPSSLHDDARRLLELLRTMVSSAFRPVLWKHALELELTYAQAQVLAHLHRHPGCLASELARAHAVTLPAVCQVLDRLDEKRLLLREGDPHDRRATRLRLTREGEALVRELEGAQIEGLMTVLARLTPDERRMVLVGLDRLVGAAGRDA